MNLEGQEELWSAYLDRELSPDERAALDRILAASPDAQRQLRELEGTSRFLRQLPAESLEESFADQVLDQLRADGLLRSEPAPAARSRTRWGWWAASPLAAAAALLLAFQMGRFSPAPSPVSSRTARPEFAADQAALSPAGASSGFEELAPRLAARELAEDSTIPPAEPLDQFKPGDAFLIMNQSGTKQIALVVVDLPDRLQVVRGVLMDQTALFQSPVASVEKEVVLEQESQVASVAMVEADEADLDQLISAVKQSQARNSLPVVDLAFRGGQTTQRFAGVDQLLDSRGVAIPPPATASDEQKEIAAAKAQPSDPAPSESSIASAPARALRRAETVQKQTNPVRTQWLYAPTSPVPVPLSYPLASSAAAGRAGAVGNSTAAASVQERMSQASQILLREQAEPALGKRFKLQVQAAPPTQNEVRSRTLADIEKMSESLERGDRLGRTEAAKATEPPGRMLLLLQLDPTQRSNSRN